MPRRSLELGELRLTRLERVAAEYEINLDDMMLRLIDLGMSVLPPVVPPHYSYLLLPVTGELPAPPTAEPTAVGLPQTDSADEPGPSRSAHLASHRAEMEWRVQESFGAYARAYVRFQAEKNAITVPMPKLDEEARRWITRSLMAYDKDLLGADQREQWKKESQTRAAGIGLFRDDFMTGVSPENKGGKQYLEPTRPWQPLSGSVPPVPRFAQLYFAAKAAMGGA